MTFVSCSGRCLAASGVTSVRSRHRGYQRAWRDDPVIREARLLGFVILLAAIFLGAHLAGSHLGPVTTSHSQVSYPGQGGGAA